MSDTPIGYYAHHHGEGHRQRAAAIAARLPGRFTLIGTGVGGLTGPFEVLELPDDRPEDGGFTGEDGCAERPASLHYAPLGHAGVRDRMRAIAAWIGDRRPALVVVDVSAEVAMLARLCSTPTVYVRLAGARWDTAHLDAFAGARALLAPFDVRGEDPGAPSWVCAKTSYVSGLGPTAAAEPRDDVVLVALGRGGAAISGRDVADAARATPGRRWRVIGPMEALADAPANLEIAGWVADAPREIAAAGTVVAGAGDGVLAAVAAAGRPYVCIPEDRPFGEQRAKVAALEAAGAAIVLPAWPAARDWPAVLERASRLDARQIATFHDPGGVARAAALIRRWAEQ